MRMILLVLALCACRADALFRPVEYQLFAPPTLYAKWWAETERCLGVQADLARVGWAVMEDDSLGAFWAYESDGRGHKQRVLAAGLWVAPHLIIVSRSHLETEIVVRHEMIHDLLQSPEHGEAFPHRCAGAYQSPGR